MQLEAVSEIMRHSAAFGKQFSRFKAVSYQSYFHRLISLSLSVSLSLSLCLCLSLLFCCCLFGCLLAARPFCICQSTSQFAWLPVCPSFACRFCLSVCVPVCLTTSTSVSRPSFISTCQPVCLATSMSVIGPFCLSIYLLDCL